MAHKDPAKRAAYMREYRKKRRAERSDPPAPPPSEARNPSSGPPEPDPVALRTPGDVLTLLEEAAAAIRAGRMLNATANAIGYLCSTALAAIEKGSVSDRMAALEATLQARGDES